MKKSNSRLNQNLLGSLTIKILWLTLLFVIIGIIVYQTLCYGEWQYWNNDSVEVSIGDPWSMRIEEEFRFGNDGTLIQEHTDIGLIYKKANWLELNLNYRHIFRKQRGEWEREARPYVGVGLLWEMAGLEFSDHNSLENRFLSNTRDHWRYRNQLRIGIPLDWTRFKISPYVSDEFFVDFDQSRFNFQRISSGFNFVAVKNLKGKLYYLWQDSEGRSFQDSFNVAGLNLAFDF